MQLLVADACRNAGSVKLSNIKEPGWSAPENEAFFSLVGNLVKKTEAFDLKGSLIALSNAAFEDGEFVNLPVVPASLLLEEEFAESFGTEIAGDAESISWVL